MGKTISIWMLTHYLSKYSLYELKVKMILEVTDFLASGFGSQRLILGSPRLPLTLALCMKGLKVS